VATAGGLDRLTTCRPRPDLPLGAGPAGPDADQRLPPTDAARRADAAPRKASSPSSIRASGPVAAAADSVEIANVARVTVTEAADIDLYPAVDPEHDLEERILKEHFDP